MRQTWTPVFLLLIGFGVFCLSTAPRSWGQPAAKKDAPKASDAKKAAAKPETLNPDRLFPSDCAVYAQWRGVDADTAAWEQTAGYEAIVKSGLWDSVSTWVNRKIAQLPGQEHHLKDVAVSLWKNGVTFGGAWRLQDKAEGTQSPVEYDALIVAHSCPPLGDNAFATLTNGMKPVNYRGRNLRVGVSNDGGPDIALWTEQTHFVVAVGGEMVARRAIDRLEDSTPTLADNAAHQGRIRSTVGNSPYFTAWAAAAPVIEAFGDVDLPSQAKAEPSTVKFSKIAGVLGLVSGQEHIQQHGIDGRAIRTHHRTMLPEPVTGFAKLFQPAELTWDRLPAFPPDCQSFSVNSVPVADWFEAGVGALANAAELMDTPERTAEFRGAIDALTPQLGWSIREDLFASLGEVICLYADPTPSIFGGSFAMAIEVRDAERFQKVLNAGITQIQASGQPQVRVTRQKKLSKKTKAKYELISIGMPPAPIWPSLTVTDKWLLLGTSAAVVESAVNRQLGDIDGYRPSSADRDFKHIPDKFTGLAMADPAPAVAALFDGLLVTLPNYLQQMRFPGDMSLPENIPAVESVTDPLFKTVSYSVRTATGGEAHSHQAFPGFAMTMSADALGPVSPIAVALVLPAVQQARAAARRTQSKNNLKMIGLALHNYHDAHGKFPQGILPGAGDPEDCPSWMYSVLPYVDQAPLYNNLTCYQQKQKWDCDAAARFAAQPVPNFINPTIPVGGGEDAFSHYAGVAGLGEDGPDAEIGQKGRGIFSYKSATGIRDITDGTSNTLAVGEVEDELGPWAQGGRGTIRPLIEKPYIKGPDGWGGRHVGGSQFLLADGSVRFISENVDASVIEAMATIAGGEAVNLP